jgi:hypothetical protein
MCVPGPVPATNTCCTQLSFVRFGEYGAIHAPTIAITTNTARITSPTITLGDRGRRNARDLRASAMLVVASGRIVVLIVIAQASCRARGSIIT